MLVRAFPLALLTLAAAFLLAPRGLEAQEPAPPESAAPQPDPGQQQPDAQTPDDDSSDPDAAVDPNAADAAQPDAAQPAATQDAPPDSTAPAPKQPHWPINQKAGMATVTWDSHGLAIDAANSSLKQILNDISTATGAKVEGMNADERVFGAYGPGQARDVLSQLLLGAGYNVIMIGDQGQGAPRQILLSTKRSGADPGAKAGAGAANGDDDTPDNEVEEQPQQPIQPPMRPAFPGGPPMNQQQMMQQREQMRLQRQQMLQQQQQQQQNNPQN